MASPLVVGVDQESQDAQPGTSTLSFSDSWKILGPFQIGTREASWGADPLEYHYGGFRNLEYDPKATFRSSLAENGTVSWSKHTVGDGAKNGSSKATATLNLGFPKAQWDFLRIVYGWQAVQFQAWARGEIHVDSEETQSVVLYTDAVLEFWVDGVHYFGGDFYSLRRAPPVLHLKPGSHKLDVRLLRDVRAMGGIGEPTISVNLELQTSPKTLQFADNKALVSDIVRNTLAGQYGSVPVRNTGTKDVQVTAVYDPSGTLLVSIVHGPVTVRPGQSKPITFRAAVNYVGMTDKMKITVEYKSGEDRETITLTQDYVKKADTAPHKMTYMHPGGIVSYAIIRPPSKAAVTAGEGRDKFPVLLQLHGSGLEADSESVAHALDPVPNLEAWVIFPTGVTPWSGDDWHNWGFADVEAAIEYIPTWISNTGWHGPGVDLNSWLVSGHSNGGQGTWYTVTHRPDKIFAAAPVSGFLSIQAYVPYDLWTPMEPARRSILDASLNSYRHELLADNCKDIPIQQQHGELDKNVPTYHSRLMHLQLFEAGVDSSYVELPDKYHWFNGVMTTPDLRQFYRAQVNGPIQQSRIPKKFSITVGNPGDMGAKGGIKVLQLEVPGRYGHMDVTVKQLDTDTCMYEVVTSNILGFRLSTGACSARSILIDGKKHKIGAATENRVFWKTKSAWQYGTVDPSETSNSLRTGRQLGALDAIMRTKGHFVIAHSGSDTYALALQISRNLFQYFYADSEIVSSLSGASKHEGNRITVVTGTQLPKAKVSSFPITIQKSGKVSVKDNKGNTKEYSDAAGLAAIFLRPLQGEQLELVVWGSDADAATRAARLVPTMTGVGQPDFVILSKSSLWKGVQGAAAMGFLDHEWKVAETSFLT